MATHRGGSSGAPMLDHPALEILDEGYLVQWAGIDPSTGEPYKPSWVPKRDCSPELVAKWEANKYRMSKSAEGHHGVLDSSVKVKQEVPENGQLGFGHDSSMYNRYAQEMNDGTTHDSGYPGRYASRSPTQNTSRKRPADTSPFSQSHIKLEDNTPQLSQINSILKKPKLSSAIFLHSRQSPAPRRTAIPTEPRAHRNGLNAAGLAESVSGSAQSDAADHDKPFKITDAWLPSLTATTKGIIIQVQGSSRSPGWFGGRYEGEKGVVLGVLSPGSNLFKSTARVKLLDPHDGTQTIYTIPVVYLRPIEPSEVGQNAIVLHGPHKGAVAKLREDEDLSWFVSVGKFHFGLEKEKLVLLLNVDDGGNVIQE